MSHLKYNSYKGFGEMVYETAHYSTAVRIPSGPRVEISGQGGWDRTTYQIHPSLEDEVDQAFENVDHALTLEGAPGMSSVYRVITFCAPCDKEILKHINKNMKKWFPNHRPLLTVIGVEKLALDAMHIEIEIGAHIP